MSTNVYDILKERGFLEQETHAERSAIFWERKKLPSILVLMPRQTA